MDSEERIYVKLQQHLDRQAVGFPATRSKVELRLLRHIFSPEEARIAVCLSYRPEPIETIHERVRERLRHEAPSVEVLANVLDRILKKGGIECQVENSRLRYCNSPLVVGMYELQGARLTPAFIRDFKAYTSDPRFGIAFLSTELPQMRTIPVAKSIRPRHHIGTFDEVAALLQTAEGPFVILECICRKKKAMEGAACRVTDRKETCLGVGSVAHSALKSDNGRAIDRDEAMRIIEENQKDRLVLQPSNTEQIDFICSCCGCCCGMLQMHRSLPKPLDFWVSNFFAKVDHDVCDGCGVCARRCQAGAVSVPGRKQAAIVDRNRCLGCGVCVPTCPKQAISLRKKSVEIRPPRTREDLYDIIMSRKKGPWGKARLTGKLIADALRTGNARAIKLGSSPKELEGS